ncbi:MAG: hypothetical protein JWQ88_1479 [Rhodoferax sp.]|nr:hypothetical protein [Rhodoferax sp.]
MSALPLQKWRRIGGSALLGVAWVSPAFADAGDTLNLTASYQLVRDDNLFRLPSSVGTSNLPGGSTTKSERVDIKSLQLALDKSYSLQRFQLNATAVDYTYQNFGYLGYTALNYSGAWRWAFTPRVRGLLSTERKRASNSFTDVSNITERNLRTDQVTRFDGEADLGAAVRLLASVDRTRVTNELPVVQEGDSTATNASAGARYVFPSGNWVSYRFRHGNGEYFNRVASAALLPTSFSDDEHELAASWVLTGKTSLTARLAHFARTHPDAPVRDYSGPVGDIRINWNATAKTSLTGSYQRVFNTYQTNTASYATGDKLTLAPVWRATAHTSMRLNYEYFAQDYAGALPGLGLPAARRDRTRTAGIALDWRPRPTIGVSLSLQNQKRSSNLSSFEYTDNTASVAAQITF